MMVFLNGRLVPEDQATISVFDRGFLYGDGLFETLRVANGKPFRWEQHMERLRKGGDFLGIKIPFACKALQKFAAELIGLNHMPEALLRITVSRGVGQRGYSPRGASRPVLVMTLHSLPEMPAQGPVRWKLHTASLRLPAGEKLAQFKTANKLAQVLARAEADSAGADEALLCNTDGNVVEGASSNLFWIEGETLFTPPIEAGLLPGVTRAVVTELAAGHSIPVAEKSIAPAALERTDGVFLTLSSLGIVGGASLDGKVLRESPVILLLQKAYDSVVSLETS